MNSNLFIEPPVISPAMCAAIAGGNPMQYENVIELTSRARIFRCQKRYMKYQVDFILDYLAIMMINNNVIVRLLNNLCDDTCCIQGCTVRKTFYGQYINHMPFYRLTLDSIIYDVSEYINKPVIGSCLQDQQFAYVSGKLVVSHNVLLEHINPIWRQLTKFFNIEYCDSSILVINITKIVSTVRIIEKCYYDILQHRLSTHQKNFATSLDELIRFSYSPAISSSTKAIERKGGYCWREIKDIYQSQELW